MRTVPTDMKLPELEILEYWLLLNYHPSDICSSYNISLTSLRKGMGLLRAFRIIHGLNIGNRISITNAIKEI